MNLGTIQPTVAAPAATEVLAGVSGSRVFSALGGLAVKDPIGWRRMLSRISQAFGATGYVDSLACHTKSKIEDANWEKIKEDACRNLFERYAKHRSKILLAGHSYGGLAQLCAAAEYPDKVGGLVLVAPAFKLPWYLELGLQLVRWTEWSPLWLLWKQIWVPLADNPGRSMFGSVPVMVAASVLNAQAEAWRALGALQTASIPVMIVHGTDDWIATPEGSLEATKALDRKGVRTLILGGLTHDLLAGDARRTVLQALTGWLKRSIGWR